MGADVEGCMHICAWGQMLRGCMGADVEGAHGGRC